jgi:hypothetical protein
MPWPDNDGAIGSWDVPDCPVRIEYSITALQQASAEAVDGLYRFRHGGAEIGGVLYGTLVNGVLRIEAVRALECQYAYGPRFVLSDQDKANLAKLTEEYDSDPDLAGIYPVGWYHSHTRSGIELSPRDLEIYDRFFPEKWQVALVLRPEQYGPVRAGFFFRERNRSIRADRSAEEFLIGMGRGKAAAVEEPEPAEAGPGPQPEAEPEPDFEPATAAVDERRETEATSEPAVEEAATEPETEESEPEEAAEEPEAEPAAEPEPEPVYPAPGIVPAFCATETNRRLGWRWILALALVVVAIGAGVYYYVWYHAPQPLSLMVTDVGGQLLIEWDRAARPIRQARTAVLMIHDGDDLRRIVLDSETLHGGSADYTRQSEVVDVSLVLDQQGGGRREALRFVGPPVKRNPSPEELQVLRERDELKAEVERLRGRLQRQGRRRQ